jgi:hypothetical protein
VRHRRPEAALRPSTRRAAFLAAAVLALVGAAPASADTLLPPAGKVFWGGQGGYEEWHIADFERQSGKHPAVYQYFVSWRAAPRDLNFVAGRLARAAAQRARALLHVSTTGTGLTPGAIARGEGDRFLVELGRLLEEHGGPVYLRPLSEMNNANNPYSPYDHRGRSRGRAYSPRAFRAMWRRLALVLRGGEVASIDRTLARLRQSPVRTDARELPSPRVALMWVPLSFGNPEIARNHPRHFWPGAGYVDWVGTTWYSPFRNAGAFDRFYRHPRWRRKPFVFAEFAVWGRESPGFIRQFFRFLRSHPRVRMAVYFQSSLLKRAFRLSAHPRSRAQLRHEVRWRRLEGYAPEFTAGSPAAGST